MKVVGLSDLHGYWKEYGDIKIPEVELLILSGDLCASDNISDQEKEIPELIQFFWSMFPDIQEIIIVPGNHDYYLERLYYGANSTAIYSVLGRNVKLLVDSAYEYISINTGEIFKLYGYPRTQLGMAFSGYYKDTVDLIPPGLDILITHDAPRYYKIPCINSSKGDFGFEEPGNLKLYEQVKKVKPRYHFFGHIHKNCEYTEEIIKFYNNSQIYKWERKLNPGINILDITPENLILE